MKPDAINPLNDKKGRQSQTPSALQVVEENEERYFFSAFFSSMCFFLRCFFAAFVTF